MRILSGLKSRLASAGERSEKAVKNILAMLFIKGGNILVGLLLVPLTINYVNSDTYGIWLTISSMVAWMSFLDIGINNGLKNRLTQALAAGDTLLAKKYVSTTYAFLLLIFIPLMVVLLLVAPHLDWRSILNVENVEAASLITAMCIVIAYFCINFVLSTINIVLLADQRPADEALRVLIQQICTLAVIFAMTKLVEGSLVKLCIAMCVCPVAVVLLFNFTLFAGRYRDIRPSLSAVTFSLAPDLLKLGVKFFLIQIAGVIQYQMVNFLIIHYFGAGEVTSYNIAYKYFNIAYMVWMILVTPIWAAVTDALAKGDVEWVKNAVRKYLKVFALFLAGSLAMLALASVAYRIWIGESVSVPFEISLWVMLFNLVMMFGSIFVNVLNGAGILNLQTVACLVSPVVFILLAMLMIRAGWGVKSILIASVVANYNGLIFAPIQYYHFIRKNAEQQGA